jgi:hypothetical protein
MNPAAKSRALTALDRLDPDGSTNLWGGLQSGLDMMQSASMFLIFFNYLPFKIKRAILFSFCSRTESQQLSQKEDTFQLWRDIKTRTRFRALYQRLVKIAKDCTDSLGFGYDLDSSLLSELASKGHGKYAFIPDSSLVGTVFVNAMSNLMSTGANEVKLLVEPSEGRELIFEDGTMNDCLY